MDPRVFPVITVRFSLLTRLLFDNQHDDGSCLTLFFLPPSLEYFCKSVFLLFIFMSMIFIGMDI